jgi:IS4 transposase
VTNSRKNDCQGFDQLILDDEQALQELAGKTLSFDLGYYSHRRFEKLVCAGVHFVTRRHHQASVQIEKNLPVQTTFPDIPQARITVIRDQKITLGSPNNRAGAVLPNLRLVTARVLHKTPKKDEPIVYQILTDRWDIPAEVVILYYVWRWEIELFFRWLKSNLHLPALLGYSKNAVELTVWLTLVVHLMLMLLAHWFSYSPHSQLLLRRLIWCWAQFTLDDFPSTSHSQLSLPFLDDS